MGGGSAELQQAQQAQRCRTTCPGAGHARHPLPPRTGRWARGPPPRALPAGPAPRRAAAAAHRLAGAGRCRRCRHCHRALRCCRCRCRCCRMGRRRCGGWWGAAGRRWRAAARGRAARPPRPRQASAPPSCRLPRARAWPTAARLPAASGGEEGGQAGRGARWAAQSDWCRRDAAVAAPAATAAALGERQGPCAPPRWTLAHSAGTAAHAPPPPPAAARQRQWVGSSGRLGGGGWKSRQG